MAEFSCQEMVILKLSAFYRLISISWSMTLIAQLQTINFLTGYHMAIFIFARVHRKKFFLVKSTCSKFSMLVFEPGDLSNKNLYMLFFVVCLHYLHKMCWGRFLAPAGQFHTRLNSNLNFLIPAEFLKLRVFSNLQKLAISKLIQQTISKPNLQGEQNEWSHCRILTTGSKVVQKFLVYLKLNLSR